jgi:hypothetical protein
MPTDKYITTQNKKLDLAPIPIATPAADGGIDSRTVATFFIYLLRKNSELKIHFFLRNRSLAN